MIFLTIISYTADDLVDHHGVAAVIMNEKGEILMQEHIKYGFWTILVGKVKQGQTVEQALREEMFEECDIHIEEYKQIVTKKFTYSRNEKQIIVTVHLFLILRYSGIVKNKEPEKHSKQLFLSLNEVQKLPVLSDNTLLYLEHKGIHRQKNLYT